MNIFKSNEPAAPVKTGIDCIREMAIARNKRVNLAGFAAEVGVSPSQFDDFLTGRSVPPVAALHAMVRFFWPNGAVFDPERNILTSPDKIDARPIGAVMPAPYDPKNDPRHIPHDPNRHYGYAPSGETDPNAGKPQKRPGWA